ncbi:MAG: hypothetical protein C4324_02205 [Blastocatellia bacterium]
MKISRSSPSAFPRADRVDFTAVGALKYRNSAIKLWIIRDYGSRKTGSSRIIANDERRAKSKSNEKNAKF